MVAEIVSLRSLVFKGAILKQLEINDVVMDRLNYELSIIEKLNLIDYFLTCSKLVKICIHITYFVPMVKDQREAHL